MSSQFYWKIEEFVPSKSPFIGPDFLYFGYNDVLYSCQILAIVQADKDDVVQCQGLRAQGSHESTQNDSDLKVGEMTALATEIFRSESQAYPKTWLESDWTTAWSWTKNGEKVTF